MESHLLYHCFDLLYCLGGARCRPGDQNPEYGRDSWLCRRTHSSMSARARCSPLRAQPTSRSSNLQTPRDTRRQKPNIAKPRPIPTGYLDPGPTRLRPQLDSIRESIETPSLGPGNRPHAGSDNQHKNPAESRPKNGALQHDSGDFNHRSWSLRASAPHQSK